MHARPTSCLWCFSSVKILHSQAPTVAWQIEHRDSQIVLQSRKRVQAFFHLHCVHHWSRFSMPYTLRHLRTSLRGFLWVPAVFKGDRSMCDLGDCAWCCCKRSCGVSLGVLRWGGETLTKDIWHSHVKLPYSSLKKETQKRLSKWKKSAYRSYFISLFYYFVHQLRNDDNQQNYINIMIMFYFTISKLFKWYW